MAQRNFKNAKPLSGKRILITRASRQAPQLEKPLRRLGAQVISIPVIEIEAPRSYAPLDRALHKIGDFDWLILTSVNGVDALFARMKNLRIRPLLLDSLKIAAIGPATRDIISERGLRVEVMPHEYVAEAVVRSLRSEVKGKRVLLVRAAEARDVIPRELRRAGAMVEVAAAYETRLPPMSKSQLRKLFEAAPPDVITFTSSSTVRNFLRLLTPSICAKLPSLGIAFASIGPITTHTLIEHRLRPTIRAREYTMQGLVTAIAKWGRRN